MKQYCFQTLWFTWILFSLQMSFQACHWNQSSETVNYRKLWHITPFWIINCIHKTVNEQIWNWNTNRKFAPSLKWDQKWYWFSESVIHSILLIYVKWYFFWIPNDNSSSLDHPLPRNFPYETVIFCSRPLRLLRCHHHILRDSLCLSVLCTWKVSRSSLHLPIPLFWNTGCFQKRPSLLFPWLLLLPLACNSRVFRSCLGSNSGVFSGTDWREDGVFEVSVHIQSTNRITILISENNEVKVMKPKIPYFPDRAFWKVTIWRWKMSLMLPNCTGEKKRTEARKWSWRASFPSSYSARWLWVNYFINKQNISETCFF